MLVRYAAFVVLVLLVAFIVHVTTRPRGKVDRGDVKDTSVASRNRPGQQRSEAIAAARERLQHLQSAHQEAVRQAQANLARAQTDEEVMTVGDWRLGRVTLTVSGVERAMSQSSSFSVQISGDVQHIPLTEEGRLTVRTDDQRVITLVAEDPQWREVVTFVGGEHIHDAERFVTAGHAVVDTLVQARELRDQRIHAAWDRLAQVRGEGEELRTARLTLEDLEGAGEQEDPPSPDR